MDTFGPFLRVLIISLVSLQMHAKAHIETITMYVDYAGVLIFTYPD